MEVAFGLQSEKSPFKHETIAVGGTFDHIHKGHRALLARAFASGEKVYVGLTSDSFAEAGKRIEHDFTYRKKQLENYLERKYPKRRYEITKLDKSFGEGMYTPKIEAIVVSMETSPRVAEANARRRELHLPDLQIEIVDLVLAEDGKKISSTRIRNHEIDEEGRLLS